MRQVGKYRKKNLVLNSVHTRSGLENSEKNSKKIQKIKKPLSSIFFFFFCQNGMRQAKRGRKKFQSRILFILDLGKKIQKQIAKKFKKLNNLFPALFLAKTGRDRPKREKKKKIQSRIPFILRPGKKIPKKIAKKFKKIKKPYSSKIYRQNGMRQVEKVGKKFQSQIPFLLNQGNQIPKNIEKKNQKIENPLSVHTRPGEANSEKNCKKIQKPLSSFFFTQNGMRQTKRERKKIAKKVKKLKNLFPALFLAKTG